MEDNLFRDPLPASYPLLGCFLAACDSCCSVPCVQLFGKRVSLVAGADSL
jgi:hypothetical protein